MPRFETDVRGIGRSGMGVGAGTTDAIGRHTRSASASHTPAVVFDSARSMKTAATLVLVLAARRRNRG